MKVILYKEPVVEDISFSMYNLSKNMKSFIEAFYNRYFAFCTFFISTTRKNFYIKYVVMYLKIN